MADPQDRPYICCIYKVCKRTKNMMRKKVQERKEGMISEKAEWGNAVYTMYVHVCIVMNINYYRGKKIESKWEMETWDGRFRARTQNISLNLWWKGKKELTAHLLVAPFILFTFSLYLPSNT